MFMVDNYRVLDYSNLKEMGCEHYQHTSRENRRKVDYFLSTSTWKHIAIN